MRKAVSWIAILAVATGCKSFEGVRDFDRSNKDCLIDVLTTVPADRNSFIVIGMCKGRGARMITDGSEKAYDRMVKCACQSGGDAVVIKEIRTGGSRIYDQVTNMSTFHSSGQIYLGTVIKRRSALTKS
jgi:hypothetical protein